MSEEIIKVLDELCKRFGIAVDWTSENVMPYLQMIADKIVKLELTEAIMGIVIALLFIGIAVGLTYLAKFCFKKYNDISGYNDWNIGGTFSIVGVVAFSIAGVAVLFGNIENIVECLVFPEKVVFDFVRYYIEAMN